MFWNILGLHLPDITKRTDVVILLIHLLRHGIELTCKDTLLSEPFEPDMKSTKTGEWIDKAHGRKMRTIAGTSRRCGPEPFNIAAHRFTSTFLD